MKYFNILMFFSLFIFYAYGMEEEGNSGNIGRCIPLQNMAAEGENILDVSKEDSYWLGPLNGEVIKSLNFKPCVSVTKETLLSLLTESIRRKNKVGSFLELTSCSKSMVINLEQWKQEIENSDELILVSPYEIVQLMPYLEYIPKNNLGTTPLAYLLQEEVLHPELDVSDKITILVNTKPIMLSGALGKCINGLRGLHTLEAMGIFFNRNGYCQDSYGPYADTRRHLLRLNGVNSTFIDTVGTILEMCHHPCLEAIKKKLMDKRILSKFEKGSGKT